MRFNGYYYSFGSVEKKWAMLSVSREHEHKGFKVSAKLSLNLGSLTRLKSTLNLSRSLIPKGSYILQVLFSVGLIKLSIVFRKPTYKSILLISGSSLFHSFNTLYCKKEFFKIFVLENSGWKNPWFRWDLCNKGDIS